MAKVVFVPGPNSHQFQKREIKVLEEVKVGRSVARCKTAPDNAIFDCKVLSRSHAVMWYQDGAVWIRDTKSSNGTFINSARLSKGGEESEPCELRSGDVIQFGVDVMETKKKDGNVSAAVTHGCIIANATVVIPTNPPPNPDSVSPFIMQRAGINIGTISRSASAETINCEEDTDIRDLHAVIKDALQRENLLNKRLQEVEGRLGMAIDAAELGWQALIKEDKLLARIELLESQLEIFTRDPTEYQNRIITLEEEKHKYQIHAKDSLRLICQEKSDALRQCSDLENSLTAGMIEVQHYKGLYDTTLEDQLKSEDTLRKKVAEVEEADKVAATALGEVKAEHEATVEGLNTRVTELEQEKTEVVTVHEEKEKTLQELVDSLQAQLLEKELEVEAGRSAVAALKEESEGVEEMKQGLETMRAENTLLKETNFTQEEEIMKLKEECEGLAANTTINPDVETDALQQRPAVTPSDITIATELAVLGIEMGTNTDEVKEAAEDEDQENQMNMPNIANQRDSYRDSMSQTEKWFDAISPSSSRSDIFSSSFSANECSGEKRYRSLRATKLGAESPRGTTWNNSTAFEGSIAHAMALIESLDDLKSSCVKFREEQQDEYRDEDSMIEDSVSLEQTDSLSSANSDTKISSPLRRRNSYREACEEDEEALPEETILGDNISETDDSQFVLAHEEHEEKPNSSVILQKVLHLLPGILDGVGSSVNIIDNMSHHAPRPPVDVVRPTPRPPLRPSSPMLARSHSPLAPCKRSNSLGSLVIPRPPSRNKKGGAESPAPTKSEASNPDSPNRGSYRRKTVQASAVPQSHTGPHAASLSPPAGFGPARRDQLLHPLTPIPPVRKYRKSAWPTEAQSPPSQTSFEDGRPT